MGTTTFYLRYNDLKKPLNKMSKKELEKLDNISPYKADQNSHYLGWRVPFELHNGNVYVLVFWKGQIMKLEQAPDMLNKKYYDRYQGKTIREYEWTLLRKYIIADIQRLDKKFKNSIRKNRKKGPI